MKYALFEFVIEKSFEIGESRWILREDPDTFNNDCWDSSKEVMVAWPHEFSKVSKKIIKSSIDPNSVENITCIAKVIKFSDHYDNIRQFTKRFCETGSTESPKNVGKRTSKKNTRYLENDEENSTVCHEKSNKRQKTTYLPAAKNELDKLKAKYNLTNSKKPALQEETEYESENSDCEYDISSLKKDNALLQIKLEKKDEEIEHLQSVITNLKCMTSLQDVVRDLKRQVERLQERPNSPNNSTPMSLIKTNSPSPSARSSSPMSSQSLSSVVEPDVGIDHVTIGPNLVVSKAQFTMLKSKTTAKYFVYCIMGMIWDREVLSTHSLTGKCSNAYKGKEPKPQLDQEKVNSICEFTSKKFGTSTLDIRQIMTSKMNNIVKVLRARQKLVPE